MFNCKLSIEGQTEPENNTTLGMNDQSQDFTGLKANHTYNITCTQVGEASTLRETSTCFRTQRTGTSGHVILHTIINNNRISRYFYTSYILYGQAIERKWLIPMYIQLHSPFTSGSVGVLKSTYMCLYPCTQIQHVYTHALYTIAVLHPIKITRLYMHGRYYSIQCIS